MSRGHKSVRLTEDAYKTLKRHKREDETFSETVERLAKERPIRDLAGGFTNDEVKQIRRTRTQSYEAYANRRT